MFIVLTRLLILLGHLQAGNNSMELLSELRQCIYLLYRHDVITKKVYDSLLKYCCSKLKSINNINV